MVWKRRARSAAVAVVEVVVGAVAGAGARGAEAAAYMCWAAPYMCARCVKGAVCAVCS